VSDPRGMLDLDNSITQKDNKDGLCTFLYFLVNDSEYSRSAGAKLIRSLSYIYLVSPGARCCCSGSCGFLLLLLRAPQPAPLFGGGSTKIIKSPVASALAVGHAGVRVGVMEVALCWARSERK
jgi:hypothetical protein